MQELRDEMQQNGYKVSGCQEHDPFNEKPITIDTFNNYQIDSDVQAVLIALD